MWAYVCVSALRQARLSDARGLSSVLRAEGGARACMLHACSMGQTVTSVRCRQRAVTDRPYVRGATDDGLQRKACLERLWLEGGWEIPLAMPRSSVGGQNFVSVGGTEFCMHEITRPTLKA